MKPTHALLASLAAGACAAVAAFAPVAPEPRLHVRLASNGDVHVQWPFGGRRRVGSLREELGHRGDALDRLRDALLAAADRAGREADRTSLLRVGIDADEDVPVRSVLWVCQLCVDLRVRVVRLAFSAGADHGLLGDLARDLGLRDPGRRRLDHDLPRDEGLHPTPETVETHLVLKVALFRRDVGTEEVRRPHTRASVFLGEVADWVHEGPVVEPHPGSVRRFTTSRAALRREIETLGASSSRRIEIGALEAPMPLGTIVPFGDWFDALCALADGGFGAVELWGTAPPLPRYRSPRDS